VLRRQPRRSTPRRREALEVLVFCGNFFRNLLCLRICVLDLSCCIFHCTCRHDFSILPHPGICIISSLFLFFSISFFFFPFLFRIIRRLLGTGNFKTRGRGETKWANKRELALHAPSATFWARQIIKRQTRYHLPNISLEARVLDSHGLGCALEFVPCDAPSGHSGTYSPQSVVRIQRHAYTGACRTCQAGLSDGMVGCDRFRSKSRDAKQCADTL
jgi:hypothetical protein